ncbi:MAG: endopeptidase La [Bacteroidaceae bacterium]|nr:endopeptidase La [Bacteroidaceae bacterium]
MKEDIYYEMPQGKRESVISLIADYQGNEEEFSDVQIDEEMMPVLPLRSMTLFPGVIMPIAVGREMSLRLINDAYSKNMVVGVFSQVIDSVESPTFNDLNKLGVAARVLRTLELPDGNHTAIIQGLTRIELMSIDHEYPYLQGKVEKRPELIPDQNDHEFKAVVDSCKEMADKFVKSHNGSLVESSFELKNTNNRVFLVNFISSSLPIKNSERFMLLSIDSLTERAYKLLSILNREFQFAMLKANIQMRTREDIDKQQRDYFLQQEMRNIQEELGNGYDPDIEELNNRRLAKEWSEEVDNLFLKELNKLERLNPQGPDYSVQYNYLDTLLNIPWNEYTKDNLNLKNAERVLNRDHYGMEKVKERILEYLAVLKKRGDLKSPIICLYGPPGVGKTSLGKSIATAMKRKYVRVSLGGLHDEAEIRGHRKTYVGAMPGRIVKGLIKAGSSNPVFILDEIDKVSQANFNGDPSSALLEVLDPEQNNAFHDNYIDLDYDLSKVMFIATANNISAIPAPLLDRMELIEVSGYLTEEKIEIAKRHLVPKELENVGMGKKEVKFSKASIEELIEHYTRESGVRELDKKINKILRKIALQQEKEDAIAPITTLDTADIETYLGPAEFNRDRYQGNEYAGVVTGLAWTSVGGEILFIETSLSKGKQGKLTLTGNLGDVMKESAVLALEYIKAHSDNYGIDNKVFDNWNIHIHVPEGAVPKDGPSAGITIATSIASALTQRRVRKNIAMTGEITLRGKVLPVGGIKEKILAAKRAGITDIIISNENEKDIRQIPAKYVDGLTFHFVENVNEVLDFALLEEKVEKPLDLTVKDEEKKDK